MRSIVEIGASVPAFLGKLWKLVNDSETNHLISWSPGGKTFVIKGQADFARDLLPLYYKHNNMASFIRQLNMYGFHKITSVENGGLRYEKDEIEFSHPCFMRGHAYLLEHIKRKIANPKSIVASSESGEKILLKPELMNKVLADVKQMKGKQESLDAKFSAMKQENEALWREVAILRQKHIKQQQIVNNLIQFLMSLVQPSRAPTANGNNVGVKRPYQLMINNAAHNANDAYPGKIKNIKLDKDNVLDDVNEDNLEDGPTIHELAHDDILHNEASQDSLYPASFVTVGLSPPVMNLNNADPATLNTHYHVTMEDGDDLETDGPRIKYPMNSTNGPIRPPSTQPIVTSPLPTNTSTSPIGQASMEQGVNNLATVSPSTSKTKAKSNVKKNVTGAKILLSANNFNTMNPSADFKLPAEIFASDDSVSDAGIATTEDLNALHEVMNGSDPVVTSSKDEMLGGINIKVEKVADSVKTSGKKTKKSKDYSHNINLADIKTELQDDFDWNNMTLATVNNNANINKLQTMNDIDDHLDSMQTDLDSLRELLRSDTYSLDTNTLLGLFGSDDPFYGLTYNAADERAKTCNNAEGNQLISYTGNIPDFEDLTMPELEGENSQEGCLSPSPSSSTLNTPQVQLRSPSYLRP
ncbi:heat shock factor protein isoform X9 [Zerene cesonia]|uniref:heat shock factor protein isoform X9 n=1 Tax=Zerene cesonia TaxID=33412 RepID=UPI0018E59FA4|nr:heat shock factor protein isoform X9 [Zerene cesonia]